MQERLGHYTLVMEIIQGKTTVAEAARAFDLPPSEIEEWVDDAKRGMENALRAKPLDIREQYEKQLKELQEAYGEAMLELRARKKLASLLGEDDR
ncbi:transposase [Salmonella enterica]|uniref:transposase n=1 Tax=Salmonella enterica TaxID=28901 RepID=UPI001BD0C49E|nr:transposase [Salmonella enterica]